MKQEASCVEVDLKQIKYQKILYGRGKMVSKEFEPSSSFRPRTPHPLTIYLVLIMNV